VGCTAVYIGETPALLRNVQSVGATVYDKSSPLFYSFLIKERVGRTPLAGDQPATRTLPTQDNANTE
jgi:hypothetical protein